MPEVKESHLLFYRLCFSCCFTLLLLLLIETGSYLVLRTRGYRHPHEILASDSSIYQRERWAHQYWQEAFEATKFSYEPYVVWKQLPFAGQTINIEGDQRRKTLNSTCGGDAYTIWMFGGSTMWGTGSPDWETIPSHLAGLLTKPGAPVCVRNFGQTGWRNTQEVIELILELKRTPRRPDLVIFYDGYNDGYSFYQSGKFDAHLNYDRIREQMERPSRPRRGGFVVDFLLSTNTARLITGARGPHTLLEGYEVPLPPPISDADARRDLDVSYLGNQDVIGALAKQYGFQYASFWQPVIFYGHKILTAEEDTIHRFYAAGIDEKDAEYKDMAEVLRSAAHPHLFDIADVFDGCRQTIYVDYVHVSPEGNQLVAQRMYDVLEHAGWLPHSALEPIHTGKNVSAPPTMARQTLPARVGHN